MQKRLGLNDFKSYLSEEMGLRIAGERWQGSDDLPLFLSKAADYRLCSCNGVPFIAAQVDRNASLPDLKRIAFQVSAQAGLPVAVVAQMDARQRKALISQGVPFVVPGRQAFLPMLGFAANSRKESPALAATLAPGTQAVLVALMANPALRTCAEVMETTDMPSSSVSRALDDLARRGIMEKSKEGREVIVGRSGGRNSLVKRAMGCPRNPVARTIYARKDAQTNLLPLAGESALSVRSMLAPPKREQRAVSKKALGCYAFEEIALGELGDEDTCEIQVWSYDPLVAGGDAIDDVSLALSLVEGGDERVIGQLNALFGEELWG